jgi:hypothetical protein
MLDDDCAYLKNLVKSWSLGKPDWHDVWRVKLRVDEDRGKIIRVGSDKKEHCQEALVIDSPLLNYMSMGQDSEAGFDFEKNRGNSQYGNLYQYACSGARVCGEGLLQSCKVKEIIRGMYNGTDEDAPPIFLTDDEEREETGAPRLRKNPAILLILNIKSYAGGTAPRLWQASVSRYGIDPPDPRLLQRPSHPGDGKLDVLTLRYAARILTGSIIGGRRVFWGAPLYFSFHSYEDDQGEPEDLVTHFNIDGEFYKVVNPSSLSIAQGGRLQVLHSAESMANVHTVKPDEIESDSESDDGDMSEHETNPQFSWCCGDPTSWGS